VTEKVSNQKTLYFFHLTSASALTGEIGNPEIPSFHLNAAWCFNKNTKYISKYHLVTPEPPFIVKNDWLYASIRT